MGWSVWLWGAPSTFPYIFLSFEGHCNNTSYLFTIHDGAPCGYNKRVVCVRGIPLHILLVLQGISHHPWKISSCVESLRFQLLEISLDISLTICTQLIYVTLWIVSVISFDYKNILPCCNEMYCNFKSWIRNWGEKYVWKNSVHVAELVLNLKSDRLV